MRIGIVGLPNVGKSTLFEAMTKKQVDRQNYPFCTIDPNVGVVAVPDERVDLLEKLSGSAKKIYTVIEFVDIAGLVKGAAEGEGLGNKFLSHIRETDAIVFVLRAFLNDKIINTQNEINPTADKEILETELMLKDLETLEKHMQTLEKQKRAGNKDAIKEWGVSEKAKDALQKSQPLAEIALDKEEKKILGSLQLLSLKPKIFILNGKENEVPENIKKTFENSGWTYLILDILTEFESAGFSKEERKELELPESTIDKLIKKSYELLGLMTFLTTGEDETRAWTIKTGSTAPQAGRAIHSDFEEKFIRAEVINWKDLLDSGGYGAAREKGLLRTEGKNYIVKDGDVIEFKI
ncbi:MAG: redox-regulated ATPase YchF [Candidatus Pacebacteria bacterium]|nr:redox-regulated ATPase YchF [Candidatus Paceibacterota bacterium]